mmetsp:Transcript_22195/g.57021  ORF Transcript_22195/g.57021 Transcript_22195/m.57021 type:complete len:289 (-) Transcript_22195:341-1207(-)
MKERTGPGAASGSAGSVAIGWRAPYSDGRSSSVMPASSLRKSWPPSPVLISSCTRASSAPALATRKVPGSISSLSSRPCLAANASNAALTGSPTVAMLVEGSSSMRPTLKPPPRLTVRTSGSCAASPSVRSATDCHTAGSEPEPMCVCTRSQVSRYCCSSACACGSSSCQMPNDEEGPPTLVLPVPPEPTPGLMRSPTLPPVHARPNRSSWAREHAFTLTPRPTTSAISASDGSSCDEMEIAEAGSPASIARRTSCTDEASICSPIDPKSCSTARLGQAFIAKRTVRP